MKSRHKTIAKYISAICAIIMLVCGASLANMWQQAHDEAIDNAKQWAKKFDGHIVTLDLRQSDAVRVLEDGSVMLIVDYENVSSALIFPRGHIISYWVKGPDFAEYKAGMSGALLRISYSEESQVPYWLDDRASEELEGEYLHVERWIYGLKIWHSVDCAFH